MATATTKPKVTTKDFAVKVVDFIARGKLDRHLEAIVNTANARRRTLHDQEASRKMVILNEPGTRVKIAGNIRPRYLLGITGTVVARPSNFRGRENSIYVELDWAPSRNRYGKTVGVPATCLEAEDAEQ